MNTLSPTLSERMARARADLRMGVPILLSDDNHDFLVLAAETLRSERFSAVVELSTAPVLALTARRAATLKARVYDGDIARLHIPAGAEVSWLHALADPEGDLRIPLKGPLQSMREGSPVAHRAAIGLCKSARLLPAALVICLDKGAALAERETLTALPLSETIEVLGQRSPLNPIIQARLPLSVSEKGRLHIFRPDDGGEEHYAIEIGRPDREKPVLARLHSACFTGDLLGSLKCDCGPQLRGALAQMGQEGAGILLYMNQEGRGIGLANKMRAYALQDQGFDTVEANHRLGFEDDERDFRLGADILHQMKVTSVRLLTNNPNKVEMMERSGIAVAERVPLKLGENHHNHAYLATKAKKSGHIL